MDATALLTSSGSSDEIKVGVLHSLRGTMAISEVTVKDAELLAIEEINAQHQGRCARQDDGPGHRRWRVGLAHVRGEGPQADLRGQGGHRLRLLDLGQQRAGLPGL
jgi:hypothetical protein